MANKFARNEHGHIVLTLTGLDLTGAAEIERLEAARYCIGNITKSCLLSTKKDGYNKNHRLVAGKIYKAALMPGKEIKHYQDRSVANILNCGMQRYGYGKPLAGLIPRVREVVSDKQMEEIGIWYAVALHDPITGPDGSQNVLIARRGDGGPWVDFLWDEPGHQWNGYGAFVFHVSASPADGGAS